MGVQFERTKLYEEVWSTPVSVLARRYNLTDYDIRKACFAMDVPLPIRGHWSKISAGHDVGTPPLPSSSGSTTFVCEREPRPPKAPVLRSSEKAKSAPTASDEVPIKFELARPHRLVAAAIPQVRDRIKALLKSRDHKPTPVRNGRWEPDWESFAFPNWKDYQKIGHVMEWKKGDLPVRVSIEAAERTLQLWDVLLKAFEEKGWTVSIRDRCVEVKRGRWHTQTRISERPNRLSSSLESAPGELQRKSTHCLRFYVEGNLRAVIEDKSDSPLESRVDDIVERVGRSLQAQQDWIESFEEKRRLADEAEKVREEQIARAEAARRLLEEEAAAKAARERALLDEAVAWRDAEAIRAYVARIRQCDSNLAPSVKEWTRWADEVADKLDPTAKRLSTS